MSLYKIRVKLEFCAGHRLLKHEGKCKTLHGHNYMTLVELSWEAAFPPKDTGMFMDFGVLKSMVKDIVNTWDHGCLLQHEDPIGPILEAAGQRVYYMSGAPTAENIASLLHGLVTKRLLSDHYIEVGRQVRVTIRETANSEACCGGAW